MVIWSPIFFPKIFSYNKNSQKSLTDMFEMSSTNGDFAFPSSTISFMDRFQSAFLTRKVRKFSNWMFINWFLKEYHWLKAKYLKSLMRANFIISNSSRIDRIFLKNILIFQNIFDGLRRKLKNVSHPYVLRLFA